MVAELPDAARRYFEYTIIPGTPLYTVADIRMTGQFGLGTKDAPGYMPMIAREVLGAPDGFVWKMSGGKGIMPMSGSDSAKWTRFWITGLVPVARAGGTTDHSRSAFGRYIAEALFWTPAALLPGPDVSWQAVDEDTAMVSVVHDGITQDVYVTVTSDGQPAAFNFSRWSNENSEGIFRNFFGTKDYFPFFIADVTDLRFPQLK